jgi:hypothetical protein
MSVYMPQNYIYMSVYMHTNAHVHTYVYIIFDAVQVLMDTGMQV